MRILKIVGIVLALLVVVFLILGLIAPTQISVERSISINASPAEVFPYLKNLKKQDLWSPWVKLDPNMQQTFEGKDGTVGAKISWVGNSDVGKGNRVITRIDDMERVDTKITFIEPWTSEADGIMKMEETSDGVKVSWGFVTEASFPSNAFFMLMGMKGSIGADYDEGLAELKEIVEEEAAKPYRLGEITESEEEKRYYVGKRRVIKIAEMQAFYAEVFEDVFQKLQEKGIEMAGMPSGVYYKWEAEKGQTEMAAAIPVKEAVELGGDYELIEIPAGKMIGLNHYGSYEGLGAAHDAIEAYIKEKGYTPRPPATEEYVSDPTQVPNPKDVLTKVSYWVE